MILCMVGFIAMGFVVYYTVQLSDGPDIVGSVSNPGNVQKSQTGVEARTKDDATSQQQGGGWLLSEPINKMDNTPVISLIKSSVDRGQIVIRCAERKTDAYIVTGLVGNWSGVRVKFDDSAPVQQYWLRSSDDTALFTPDPIAFSKRLAKAHSFLFEFKSDRTTLETIEFDVSGLDAKLGKISRGCAWEPKGTR